MCVYVYIMCIYIYIYIHRERERERDLPTDRDTRTKRQSGLFALVWLFRVVHPIPITRLRSFRTQPLEHLSAAVELLANF